MAAVHAPTATPSHQDSCIGALEQLPPPAAACPLNPTYPAPLRERHLQLPHAIPLRQAQQRCRETVCVLALQGGGRAELKVRLQRRSGTSGATHRGVSPAGQGAATRLAAAGEAAGM